MPRMTADNIAVYIYCGTFDFTNIEIDMRLFYNQDMIESNRI